MTENNQENQQKEVKAPESRPNDTGAIAVDGFLKIYDPKSRKVYVEQQA